MSEQEYRRAAVKALREIRKIVSQPMSNRSLADLKSRLYEVSMVTFRGREAAGVEFGGRG